MAFALLLAACHTTPYIRTHTLITTHARIHLKKVWLLHLVLGAVVAPLWQHEDYGQGRGYDRKIYADNQTAWQKFPARKYEELKAFYHWRIDRWDRTRCLEFGVCQLLRHARCGVWLRVDGSFSLRKLAKVSILAMQEATEDELLTAVQNCERDPDGKKRVEEVVDDTGADSPRGRACQGHNPRAQAMIERWRMMDEIYPGHPQWPASSIAAHGTFRQFIDSICKHGLQAGGIGGRRADNKESKIARGARGGRRISKACQIRRSSF